MGGLISPRAFLFNVVVAPPERASLNDVYNRMVAEYKAWHAPMLPEGPQSY